MNERLPNFVEEQNENNVPLQLNENPPEPVSSLNENTNFITEQNFNFNNSFDPISSSTTNNYLVNSVNNDANASSNSSWLNLELPHVPEWNNSLIQNFSPCSSSNETQTLLTNEIPLEPSQDKNFVLSTTKSIQSNSKQLDEIVPTVLHNSNEKIELNNLTNQKKIETINDTKSVTPSSSSQSYNNTSHPSDPTKFHINNTLLTQILEYGFSEYIAILAIQKTKGVGLEQAINWIIDYSNASEIEKLDKNMGSETSHLPETETTKNSFLQNTLKLTDKFLNKTTRIYKMIFVVNMSLKMGTGKLAAQVGHATLGVYRVAQKTAEGQQALDKWRYHGEVKIVLRGQDTEQLFDLLKQAKDANLHAYLVQDAGFTQIPAGSHTVLGIFGAVESIDKITGALKLL